MPIQFQKNVALLSDFCTVEEAEILLQWLQKHPKAKINLSACRHLHSSVLQVLMAAHLPISAWPEDVELSRWLKVALLRSR